MGKYMFVVLFVLLLHMVITYGSAVSLLGKLNPIKFIKEFSPAMIVAFSTSSSAATLPISMKTLQNNLKVSKSVSGFVQPLGATINMDGTAIMQGVATIFIAQVYGADLGIRLTVDSHINCYTGKYRNSWRSWSGIDHAVNGFNFCRPACGSYRSSARGGSSP